MEIPEIYPCEFPPMLSYAEPKVFWEFEGLVKAFFSDRRKLKVCSEVRKARAHLEVRFKTR